MSTHPRRLRQGEGTAFLLGLTYPVWLAAVQEAGRDEAEIFTDDFGHGEGVLLLQNQAEIAAFTAQLQPMQRVHPHTVTPIQLNSLQEVHDWMSGPVKAHGIHGIYFWEWISAR